MRSFFFSLLSFGFFSAASPAQGIEDFAPVDRAINEAILRAELRQTHELMEFERWYLGDYLSQLEVLERSLRKLSKNPNEQESFQAFEAQISLLSCFYFFEDEDQAILTEMNRLHSKRYGTEDQFELWMSLKGATANFLSALPDAPVRNQYAYRLGNLDTLRWAAKEFSLDLANLLFHHNSPHCVRPQHRAPKTMKELWLYDESNRAPHEKYALLVAAWGAFSASDQFPEAEAAFIELQALVAAMELDEREQELRGFSALIADRLQSMKEVRWNVSDIETDLPLQSVRLDYVAKVYDSRGRLREIYFPMDSKDFDFENAAPGAEVVASSKTLLKIMHRLESFSLMRSHLRLSFEGEGSRVAFLDFYWGRRIGSPFVGLKPQPIYPPLNSEHSPEELFELIDSGHFDADAIEMNRQIFLEDLRDLEPVYDQLKIVDESGMLLRTIPIIDEEAKFRRLELVESLKLAFLGEDPTSLQYRQNSSVRLKAHLNMKISSR